MKIGEIRLDIQPSPSQTHIAALERHIDLGNLSLVFRGGNGFQQSIDLSDALESDAQEPYVWAISTVVFDLPDGLRRGNAIAMLVDRTNPNVDLDNFQFRRVGGITGNEPIEASSADQIRMVANIAYRSPTDTDVSIEAAEVDEVRTGAGVTFTPFTGISPVGIPMTFETREKPNTGRYRGRRWIDHTEDLNEANVRRALGEPGSASASLRTFDKAEVVFDPASPEYLARAIYQRLLEDNDIGLTFPADTAGAHLEVEDEAVLDGITVEPSADLTKTNWIVTDRHSRGGQRYSLFDRGDAGPNAMSGIRARQTARFATGGLPISLAVEGVSFSRVLLSTTGFSFQVEAESETVIRDLLVGHTIFVRHDESGESWSLPLRRATVSGGNIVLVTLPESERGGLQQHVRDSASVEWTVVIVRTSTGTVFTTVPNERVDIGQREIVLGDGDSLFDLMIPAGRDEDEYAGLLARIKSSDPGGAGEVILSDVTSRFPITAERFVSGISVSSGNRVQVDVQDRLGSGATLDANTLAAFTVVFRKGAASFPFTFTGATFSNGRYTLQASAVALRNALTGSGSVTVAVVEVGHYALAAGGESLGTNNGDFYEIDLQHPLLPRSTDTRYLSSFQANPPRIAYGQTRHTSPWVPPDGTQFRSVLHLWQSNAATLTIPSAGKLRLTRGSFEPPIVVGDRILVMRGVDVLDGSDPRDTPFEITSITNDYIEADANVSLTGEPGVWFRSIDRVQSMDGLLINPKDTYSDGQSRDVSFSGIDHSGRLDYRSHDGGVIVSTPGETYEELIKRLFNQWQTGIPGVGSENIIVDAVDQNVVDPSFDTLEAGGNRTTWRGILDAIRSRAGGHAGWRMVPPRTFQWRRLGEYTGLTLVEGDYSAMTYVEDRSRARNVVDTRQTPELIVKRFIEDRIDIDRRARLEDGTGRYEVVDDSPEGNDPGLLKARAYALDSLRRYPFLRRYEFRTIDAVDRLVTYQQMVRLVTLQPGDVIRFEGPHIPNLPPLTASVIADGVVYFEPPEDKAVPSELTIGKLIRIPEHRQDAKTGDPYFYGTDPYLYGTDQYVYGETSPAIDQDEVILDVIMTGGPRGSFACQLPDDVSVDAGVPLNVHVVEQGLVTDLSYSPLLGGAGLREWTLGIIAPRELREPGQVALAQDGDLGSFRRALAGALG